jgi:hypothetical protein
MSLFLLIQGAGESLIGLKEEIQGKILKKPDLVEHGKQRRTGVLKKREAEEAEVSCCSSMALDCDADGLSTSE